LIYGSASMFEVMGIEFMDKENAMQF